MEKGKTAEDHVAILLLLITLAFIVGSLGRVCPFPLSYLLFEGYERGIVTPECNQGILIPTPSQERGS